ncbi:protein AATF/BFR2 [Geosmithia morbida]|uniref:Protein BFR2 n=1 Tax=Geosmithia morbida TaxID=1094350 RepID=A0A9P4YVU9_9HYPO|nr:protein AATF/BFR2 [Geosmithia morbida]KAF4122724.1 protein AATF/BFR2 [Geosmithia morbida]
MAKVKGRAAQFEEDEHIVNDYDPEAEGRGVQSDNDSDVGDVANAGTEHYEIVGASKLRQKDPATLGPQYRGAKVSRAALEQESDEDDGEEGEDGSDEEGYADPETANLEADEDEAADSDIPSDDALAESDAERLNGFVFRGSSRPLDQKKKKNGRATAADFMSDSEDEEGVALGEDDEDDGEGEDDSGEDEDMDDGLDALADGGDDYEEEDDDDDEDEDEDDEEESDESDDDEDGKKKKNVANKQSDMAASANADIQKGLAIQQQRKIYDGLLNLRIRLQKALVAANTFPTLDESASDQSSEGEPYSAAEEAAAKLLNTISDLRVTFGPSRAGSKRKYEFTASTASAEIWKQMQADDKRYAKVRRDNLDKWSAKVQAVNAVGGDMRGPSGRNKGKLTTLSRSLEDQLANTEYRLVKRTKVARSCAPIQAARNKGRRGNRNDDDDDDDDDDGIYDDADLYQQLLKELVDQRTVDSTVEQASAVPSVMVTAASAGGKSRKNVDRKASKGRKIRFTVHEKLQNFMAPEDRRAWEQSAVDRLFGTLFGRKLALDEESDEEGGDDDVDMKAHGEVRLFG